MAKLLVLTMGCTLDDGCAEALTSTFATAIITPSTRIAPGAGPLEVGRRFRGTTRKKGGRVEVAVLRSVAPDAGDATQLDEWRGKLARAGVSTTDWGDSMALLTSAWQPVAGLEVTDLERFALERLFCEHHEFPTGSWEGPPTKGIERMSALLQRLGIAGADSATEMIQRAVSANPAPPPKGLFGLAHACLHDCRTIAATANQLLAAANDERRFHEFAAPRWQHSLQPLWLLLGPRQAEGLIAEKALKAREVKE